MFATTSESVIFAFLGHFIHENSLQGKRKRASHLVGTRIQHLRSFCIGYVVGSYKRPNRLMSRGMKPSERN